MKKLLKQIAAVLPDKSYLKLLYFYHFKKCLNLKNPQTFNEKLQWLKLHDRNPEYMKMVDKCEVKRYVADKIGEEYIIPTLGVWNKAEDIDFDKLPKQFVLKVTNGGGGNEVLICKDKSKLDIGRTRRNFAKYLKRNHYLFSREWAYKGICPRVIAEQYMVDISTNELRDYKIFNFNGVSKLIQMDYNRFVKHMKKLYTPEWNEFDFEFNYSTDKNAKFDKPATLIEMLQLAKKLSAGIPFLRTDFYCVNGKTYIGELTFYPAGGFGKFAPEKWDRILGDWLILPKSRI